MNDSVIKFENISFRRGQNLIIDSLNWEVMPGENWVVFGPNGSGKTTLLNLLTGYLWPTGGEISVLEKTYGKVDLRDFRKNIGW